MGNITLGGLRLESLEHALTREVMWQFAGSESLNALVLLVKWPFILHYSHTCTELWFSAWLHS